MKKSKSKGKASRQMAHQRRVGARKAFQQVLCLILLGFGVQMVKAEKQEISTHRTVEKDLFPAFRAESGDRWRKMESCEFCEWRLEETSFRLEKEMKNSQGQDPRTFEENSQGKGPSTFEGRGHKAERWRVQEEKMEEGEVEEEEEKEQDKEEGGAQQKEMVEKVQRDHHKPVYDENERRRKGKGEQKEARSPKVRQTLGKYGKWLFLLPITGQNWLSVGAAAEGQQRRTEAVMRMHQEVQVKPIQMGGGEYTKVEAAKRRSQN